MVFGSCTVWPILAASMSVEREVFWIDQWFLDPFSWIAPSLSIFLRRSSFRSSVTWTFVRPWRGLGFANVVSNSPRLFLWGSDWTPRRFIETLLMVGTLEEKSSWKSPWRCRGERGHSLKNSWFVVCPSKARDLFWAVTEWCRGGRDLRSGGWCLIGR